MNLKNLKPHQVEKVVGLMSQLPETKSNESVVMKQLITLIKQTYEIENEYEEARANFGIDKIQFLETERT
tara:strand:+ start:621 stop:830 length:210 start_codon:yes stop_codon:yes gene_type:complete